MPQPKNVRDSSAHGIPNVSPDDLFAFHEAHFSQAALTSFGSDFVDSPSQDDVQHDVAIDAWEEEDDGLGYYPDGVKRTLTDEQIEIFRHSELEALRRGKEKQLSSKAIVSLGEAMDLSDNSPALASTENDSSALPTTFQSNKKRKKKKGSKRARPEPKPDLRKRTWDVVDKGLDSLEYD
ncbi:hypothetical protein FSARC_5137 [Fusarium sarcochroum]|uniref:Uncharacterized protein n=1 Tax=Fusarium sarcochroum TaxID=1208366 RepID=A0A8H4X9V3_9HYPO|nr:hypothetical protein FSARC_5137 [Fusarium sarcochroum]